MFRTLIATTLLSLAPAALAAEPTIEELLLATDDVARGDSSVTVIEMQVKTAHYERTMKLKAWSQGTERSLIRILEPAKDAGISTLKVDQNIWNYLPKVDRTMKVPAGMMSGSWMGSHFTNDDLVRESRLSEDFDYAFEAKPDTHSRGNYVISLTPKPDAPVVWGKITLEITPDKIPVEALYYDEKGGLVRTMTYADVREVAGRMMPTTMTLIPADAPEEFTRVSYGDLEIGVPLEDSLFTLQALKQ